jgi:hypothetical protein
MTQSAAQPAPELPKNIEAEKAVLGAILIDPTDAAFKAATDKLKSADFSLPENQIIFHEMIFLHEAGTAIDTLTLFNRLEEQRKTELAGGVGYLSKLMDGVPSVSNVSHYASIVHDKSLRRQMMRAGEKMVTGAANNFTSYDDLYAEFQNTVRASTNGNGNHLRLIDGRELLTMDTSPLEFVIDPILPTQGLGMLYAWRGCGKTYFMLDGCYSISIGAAKWCQWRIPKARRVVYVDGELPHNQLQARWQGIVKAHGMQPPEEGMMNFINRTIDKRAPNIAELQGQRLIEDHLQEGTFLVLDNISALCRTGKEDEEGWASTQEWLIELRHKGITTQLLHHAGKSGAQRGTSKREDFLDAILMMRHPSDYSPDQLLRCEVHCEKYRGDDADAVLPFEVRLESDSLGGSVFTHRALQDVVEKRAIEMFGMGMKVTEIADDLHLSRFQVYRIKKKMSSLP